MRKRVSAGSVLGIPYLLFQILFIVVPLLVIVYYAFTDGQGSFPRKIFCTFLPTARRWERWFTALPSRRCPPRSAC